MFSCDATGADDDTMMPMVLVILMTNVMLMKPANDDNHATRANDASGATGATDDYHTNGAKNDNGANDDHDGSSVVVGLLRLLLLSLFLLVLL